MFWFLLPLSFFSETFLILRRHERDIIMNLLYMGIHVKYPLFLSDFNGSLASSTDFWEKRHKYQFLWKSVQWESSCSIRTDRQTHMTRLTVAFLNFTKAPKSSNFKVDDDKKTNIKKNLKEMNFVPTKGPIELADCQLRNSTVNSCQAGHRIRLLYRSYGNQTIHAEN